MCLQCIPKPMSEKFKTTHTCVGCGVWISNICAQIAFSEGTPAPGCTFDETDRRCQRCLNPVLTGEYGTLVEMLKFNCGYISTYFTLCKLCMLHIILDQFWALNTNPTISFRKSISIDVYVDGHFHPRPLHPICQAPVEAGWNGLGYKAVLSFLSPASEFDRVFFCLFWIRH